MDKRLKQEVATSRDGRDITLGYVDRLPILPTQDLLLIRKGLDLGAWEEVLMDDQVAATFQQRRLAVTSAKWEVRAGADDKPSTMAADFLRETLQSIGWDRITDRMLFGVFFGFAVSECMWAQDGRHITLTDIKVRRQKRFAFGPDGALKLLTSTNPMGEALPDKKFWHFSTGASHDDEMYGQGLAHWLYWPVYFKRNIIKIWLTTLDKFGMPSTKGTYSASATKDERRDLLKALAAIHADSSIIVPEGMDVSFLESARSGTLTHEGFLNLVHASITKVVLSQTLTSESAGGQYKADVQKSVRNEVVQADADLVNDSFNRSVAVWLTEWNFPNATPPIVVRQTDEEEDLTQRADRDAKICGMGFKPTLEYITKTYGDGWIDTPARASPREKGGKSTQNSAFAEDDAEDDPVAELLASSLKALKPILIKLLKPVRDYLKSYTTLEQAGNELFQLYPLLDSKPLAESLEQGVLLAELAGRYAVLQETGDAAFAAGFAEDGGIRYGGQPFKEAVEFFRAKVNVPTEGWRDLMKEGHDTGFMVAGAMKAELLNDLRGAVDESLAEGTTLATFRKKFDQAVAENDWQHYGGRNWRSRLIFETNHRTAYNAGRYRQMTHPDLLISRPYWQYLHGGGRNPRKQHLAWSGLVLRADDAFWNSHFPPNGFNCHCRIQTLAERDLRRMGKAGPDTAPQGIDGVDEGWDYTPGKTSLAWPVARQVAKSSQNLPVRLAAAVMANRVIQSNVAAEYGQWVDDLTDGATHTTGERRTVGTLSEPVLDYLADKGIEPGSAAVEVRDKDVLHMLRDAKAAKGKALPVEMVKQLPEMIAKPAAVLWDRQNPALLYVFPVPGEERLGKAVVRVDYILKREEKTNIVRTAGLVAGDVLKTPTTYDLIKGKL